MRELVHTGRALVAALSLALPGVALVACGGQGARDASEVGSVKLALTLDEGNHIHTVDWEITGGSLSSPMAGSIPVDDPGATISARIGGIPGGHGYTITLTASSNQGTICTGSASFDIHAGQTTSVAVFLNCRSQGGVGDLIVHGSLNQCPVLESVTAVPLQVAIGGQVTLDATASDADDASLIYQWSATSGAFGAPAAAHTTFTCSALGVVTLTLAVDDGHACGVSTTVDVLCVEAPDPNEPDPNEPDPNEPDPNEPDPNEPLHVYTFGHADVGFEFDFDENAGEFAVHLHVEGATVDGVPNVSNEYELDEVQIWSNARFTRPANDFGFFAPLCVESNESVYWLPQTNGAASSLGVPFLGLAAEVATGVFVGNQVTLSLIDVDSPSGTGHYTLWKDGFPPVFQMSSCDGIDAADGFDLPIGHDHFNHGFTEPGEWRITYEVRGQLVSGGGTPSTQFTVSYVLED